jgi:hypothetical protein
MKLYVYVLLAILCCIGACATGKQPTLSEIRQFDGAWNVTLVCAPEHKGSTAGYTYKFKAHVKDGVLHGEYGTKDVAPNLTLEGEIKPNGSAHLIANGLVGNAKYVVDAEQRSRTMSNKSYSYDIDANFAGSRGTGKRIQTRECNVTFVKR